MIFSSLLSLVLLVLAGVLLDAHRRDRRLADRPEETAVGRRFARSRFRRRMIASAMIAVLGVLVAVWPAVPREPTPVLTYLAALCLLALTLIGFAVTDAWASGAHYRGESRRQLAEHAAQLREALEPPQRAREPARDAEATRR